MKLNVRGEKINMQIATPESHLLKKEAMRERDTWKAEASWVELEQTQGA